MISEKVVQCVCMPGHTIEALIKKENRHDVTREELNVLLERFNAINPPVVPKAGNVLNIPILQRHLSVIK